MQKIDEFPTHEKDGVRYRPGRTLPFGAELVSDSTVNFSIFSREATSCELLLYHLGDKDPYAVLPLGDEFRIGNVYTVMIFDLDWENTEYGYRFDGPRDRSQGYRFDPEKILLDPYAKLVSGRDEWYQRTYPDSDFQRRGRIIREDYNWEGDRPLEIPPKDLVIYEMHVRGFTKDPSSKVKHGGTFAGVVEKIPYLKKLGVNCVELLPVFEFEEFITTPTVKACNYWGYVTYNYFSPKTGYSSTGKLGLAADELKHMIKMLHQSGIEVVLDVVFNHTGEGGDDGEYISFRGIDNRTYYIMDQNGRYTNYTGCQNTVNCNNAIVRNFIIDSLRYWVSDYHVDGFRIDEAPIFVRDEAGKPMASAPLVDSLIKDPVLSRTLLISEGWDAGGMCTIGNFSNGWADWNPRSRDTIKRFIKGMGQCGPDLLKTIEGSPDMFPKGSPASSVNYVTSHDGFPLYDSVSYGKAHNENNAFTSRMDSAFDNCSWNCGAEGETDNEEIMSLRRRQMKNATMLLMLSRGIPMFWAGDEFANTQYGNNNAFSQDSRVSWLDWTRLDEFQDVFEFHRRLIAFRMSHPVLRQDRYFTGYNSSGYPELSWHGEKPWNFDKNSSFLTFAFLYAEPAADFGTEGDSYIYCLVNEHWEEHEMELPIIPAGMEWRLVLYTGDPGFERVGETEGGRVRLMPRSCMLLEGKKY